MRKKFTRTAVWRTAHRAGDLVPTGRSAGPRQAHVEQLVNFAAGQTIANTAIVDVGTDGRVCLFSPVTTHLVVDAAGYYP